MGAYLLLFPRVRVFTIVPLGFYATSVALPAWAMLIYWAFFHVVAASPALPASRPAAWRSGRIWAASSTVSCS
jgi:hypothetical protein